MKFSVLMSVYQGDCSAHLDIAIGSIWTSQTLKPTEIILVKDGILNEKLDLIIEKWHKKLDKVLKIVTLDTNAGLASALNYGLKFCNYDLIARMDSDDISLPERFEHQINYLELNRDVDVVGSWIEEFEGLNNPVKIIKYPTVHKDMLFFFKKRDPLAHPSVMFRKSFFKKSGLYNESLSKDQDTELWFKGFSGGAIFANIDKPLLRFRKDSTTLSRRKDRKRLYKFLKLRFKIIKKLNFGILSYFYAILYISIQLMPVRLTNFIYKYFR